MSTKVMMQALEALETEQALRHGYSYLGGVRIVSTADAAINALRTAIQQATHPAEVTDEQIAACVKRASTYGLPFVGLLNPGGTPSDFSKRFTAEILALLPVQVPMTDEERKLAAIDWSPCVRAAFNAGVNAAERHHGITAQWRYVRPTAVPMTEDQVWHNDALMSANGIAGFKMDALIRIVRAVEAHHGITAQAKEGG